MAYWKCLRVSSITNLILGSNLEVGQIDYLQFQSPYFVFHPVNNFVCGYSSSCTISVIHLIYDRLMTLSSSMVIWRYLACVVTYRVWAPRLHIVYNLLVRSWTTSPLSSKNSGHGLVQLGLVCSAMWSLLLAIFISFVNKYRFLSVAVKLSLSFTCRVYTSCFVF